MNMAPGNGILKLANWTSGIVGVSLTDGSI